MQTFSSVITEYRLPSSAAFSNFSPSSCVDKFCSHRLRNKLFLCLMEVMILYLFCWLVHFVKILSSIPAQLNDADFNPGKRNLRKSHVREGVPKKERESQRELCLKRNRERDSVARERKRVCGLRERERHTESVWMIECALMCLYVCVYTCVICVCVCVRVWVCEVYVWVCVRARTHVHVRACFDCVCDSCIFLHIYMYLDVHIRIQLYRYRCVCAYVCVCVCVCVCLQSHTHIHIHKVRYDHMQRTHALKHTRIYTRIGKCISGLIKWWTEISVFPKRGNYLTISTCVCMCARESEQQKKTDREGAPISCFFCMDTR